MSSAKSLTLDLTCSDRQVIYVCKEENWTENRALWDARGDWDFFCVNSIDYHGLFSIIQKVLNPF